MRIHAAQVTFLNSTVTFSFNDWCILGPLCDITELKWLRSTKLSKSIGSTHTRGMVRIHNSV